MTEVFFVLVRGVEKVGKSFRGGARWKPKLPLDARVCRVVT
jgi:hypothetical protein